MRDNKMNFFKKYTTPFGYVADGNQVDAYGVDHSGFSTRDELEYQFSRFNREKHLADILKQHGIPQQDYPQLGIGFWQNNLQSNDDFESFEIAGNVENRPNQTQQDILLKQFGNNFANVMKKYGIDKIMTNLYNLSYDLAERAFDYEHGNSRNLDEYDNLSSAGKAENEAFRLNPVRISDVNKHRYVSCVGAYDGPFSAMAIGGGRYHKRR